MQRMGIPDDQSEVPLLISKIKKKKPEKLQKSSQKMGEPAAEMIALIGGHRWVPLLIGPSSCRSEC